MRMWAALTTAFYVLCLLVLVGPLFQYDGDSELTAIDFHLYFTPILVVIQVLLLLVPVQIARERPIKKRHILISAFTVGLAMTVLMISFIGAVFLLIWGEDQLPNVHVVLSLLIPLVLWFVWGTIFYKSYSSAKPRQSVTVMTRWLLRGSILELLVAVPSHIISRQRNECCAPAFTFLGIATGLSLALLAFGPGLFFLFAQRVKNKKRAGKSQIT